MKKFLVAITLFLIAALPALAQTVPLGPRFVLPYQTVVDGTGTPIPGALLYFYSSGTNIPLATYSNPLLTTPNSNPVQANAAGVFPAIFLSGNYKIVLTDASNNQIWAADPVYGVGTGGSTGSCLSITVNPQTGTSYTLQPSDNCKLVTFINSQPIAVSLPSPATNAAYQQWNTTVSDVGTGVVTVTPTGASFTGTGSGTNLTASGVTGTIASGFLVTGTGVPANTAILSQSSGTPGGAGVYVTSNATTSSGASLTAAAGINGGNTSLTVLPGQAAQIISDGTNYQVVLSSPAGSSISVGSTVVLGGIVGNFLSVGGGRLVGQVGPTGTGQVVLQTAPTIITPIITGSLTATGLVTNADLVNSQVTINGTACVLGGTCSPTAAATSITVGTTTIAGGSGAGHVLADSVGGTVAEISSTITVNGTACALGSTCAPSSAATSITIGTTSVVSGSANALLAQSASGATVAEITTGNNQTLITNGSGVSSFSATLPPAVQGNITSTGTLTGGATGAGFTIALTTSTVTGINVVTNGGTGLATLTAGAIYKGAGTSVIAVSALSDNGTIVSTTEPIDLKGNAALSEIANASSTGTTVNKLAKLTGAPSTALITATTDVNGAVGVVIGGAGTTGNAQIAVSGQATCAFDGGTMAGDYVQISGSVPGDCTDAGPTYPTAHQVIGRVLATIGSAGNAAIVVFPPEIDANTGGGGSGVTSVTLIAGTGMNLSGSCTSTTSISCTLNTPWSISGSNIYNNNVGGVNIGSSAVPNMPLVVGNVWGADASGHPYCDVRALGGGAGNVTNDDNAFKTAFSTCAGGMVFIPNGTYHATVAHWTVSPGTRVQGASELGAVIISTLTADDVLLCGGGNNNTTFGDFTIQGPAGAVSGTVPTSGWGINCSGGGNNEHFERLYITGTYNGIAGGGTNNTMLANRIESLMGTDMISDLGGGGQIAYNQLDNNVIFDGPALGGSATFEVYPGGSHAVALNTTVNCNGYLFVTTTGGTTGAGSTTCNNANLVPTAMYTTIPDPHGGSTVWECIGNASLKVVEPGNSEWILSNDMTSPSSVGIYLSSANNASNVQAVGNNIAGQILAGIEFTGGSVSTTLVNRNTFQFIGRSGSQGYPIYDNTAGGDVLQIIQGNYFDGCGDACIVDQGNLWNISGNIINGFDGITSSLGGIATSGPVIGTTINGNIINGSGLAIQMSAGGSANWTTVTGNTTFGAPGNISLSGSHVVNANNN